MGRYWYLTANNEEGRISCDGKFWFAVQDSTDFEKLGFVKSEGQEMCWKGCRCCFKSDDRPNNYCDRCYDSYEEHLKTVQVEEDDDVSDGGDLWESNDSLVTYEATKQDIYHIIQGMIKGYEAANVDKWFDKYSITHTCDSSGDTEVECDASWASKTSLIRDQLEIMARYDLCMICKYVFDLGADYILVDCEF